MSSAKQDVPQGVEVPEDELRSNIDKTADYVLKNGDSFETRLKTSDGSVSKFGFLFNDNKYYNYYQWKLGRYESKTQEVTEGVAKEQEIEETPKPLEFLLDLPSISSLDLQIIKVTALFVARNGEDYGKKLHKHQIEEGRKAQFEFMNDTHSLNGVFRTFVNQYKSTIASLEEGKVEIPDLFEDGYIRAKHHKINKVKKDTELKEKQRRQMEYASINWQEFTIVGKLQFDAIDKVTELAIPLNRDELVYRTLEAKTKEVELQTAKIETGSEDNGAKEPRSGSESESTTKEQHEQEHMGPIPKGMKIKEAGQSRLKKKASKEPTIKCPITGRMIPESKFDEHIRILLRDTNYEQQKQNYINKNFKYASNLTNDEVYENIKRLTRKRPTEESATTNSPVKKIGP